VPGPSLRLGARHQKRELLWANWAEQELLEDVPHRQVVFTIPKRLRIFFRYDRRLLGELAACAWRALELYFEAYFAGAGVTPGAVGIVQTAGELLSFHPHVHVQVTDGGFLADGTFRPLAWFDSRYVERLFRAEVLRMLLDKELISEATIDNLLSWHHSGEARWDVLEFLARVVDHIPEPSQ
jgi:hypothetical protein